MARQQVALEQLRLDMEQAGKVVVDASLRLIQPFLRELLDGVFIILLT